MTLGEEIIGLSTRGIDTPTVERMYRKYIEMAADKESKEAMRAYCINDELAIEEFINTLFGVPTKSDLKDAEVGDKTTIKLDGLGEFAATVHKVTDDKVMLILKKDVTSLFQKSFVKLYSFQSSIAPCFLFCCHILWHE